MSPMMESKASKKLLSTIYRQQWPPPSASDNASMRIEDSTKPLAGNLWKGGKTFNGKLATTRQRLGKQRVIALPNTIQRPESCLKHERPTSAITDKERRKLDEDLRKVEYVTMLSNKNFLRKVYRNQYRSKESTDEDCNKQRPISPSKVTIGGYSEDFKYYPDMGSIISRPSSRKCVLSSTTSTPIYPKDSWKILNKNTASLTSENESSITLRTATTKTTADDKRFADSQDMLKRNSSTGGFLYTAKGSWSNVPMQKKTTDTLASISLEGRATINQTKSTNLRSSSFNSYSEGTQHNNRLSSAGESVSSSPSLDSEASKGGEFIVFRSTNKEDADHEVYYEDEEYQQTKLLIDPSIFFDGAEICKSLDETNEERKLPKERKETASIESADSEYFSSDDSESEMNDEFVNEVLNQEEGKRRLEKVSAVFCTHSEASEEDYRLQDANEYIVNQHLGELSFEDDDIDDTEDNKYQFPDIFIPPFDSCEATTLANLPQDVDWKTFVGLPKFLSKLKNDHERKRSKCNRNGSGKIRKQRASAKPSWDNIVKRYNDAECFMDKLINLERMQSMTVQYEKERRRHLMHVQRARSRAQRQRRPSTANIDNSNIGKVVSNKQVSVQHELNRLMKTVTPTSDSRNDDTKSTKPPTRAQTPRRFTNYKRPWQPQSYDYACSERIKGAQLRYLSYSKTRTCSSCRERTRKLSNTTSTLNLLQNRSSSSAESATTSLHINYSSSNRSAIKLNLSSTKTKQVTNEEDVHGICLKTEERSIERKAYSYGHASFKPPNLFNSMSSAGNVVNSIGKGYANMDIRKSAKSSATFQRPRTTSFGSRQKKRFRRKEEYYTSYSNIKLDFSKT